MNHPASEVLPAVLDDDIHEPDTTSPDITVLGEVWVLTYTPSWYAHPAVEHLGVWNTADDAWPEIEAILRRERQTHPGTEFKARAIHEGHLEIQAKTGTYRLVRQDHMTRRTYDDGRALDAPS